MSSKNRKKRRDDDDDGFIDDSDEEGEEDEDEDEQQPAAKKRKKQSFIDDAAEESGDEDDEDDEDDEEGDNDYVKDGFVVDEEEEDKKKKDDLEDSDDDDDDDDDDAAKSSRLKKVRKMRELDRLDEEDLALIQEARRGGVSDDDMMAAEPDDQPQQPRERVVAKTEAELRKGLFYDSGGEDDREQQQQKQRKPMRVERYDEDGMDDFIEDDIGDQDAIRMSDRKSGYDDEAAEVNMAQLHEANEIFGVDYADFMQEAEAADEGEEDLMGKRKYRERGVGVSYGMDSDEEVISSDDDDDDDDLFGDDEDEGMDGMQRAEALRLKREKRKLAKAERRREALKKKNERRKAMLRRAFEPVQLVENFCTDRDDDIRLSDVPERFYDWKIPFYGSEEDGMNDAEEEQARWIASRIPDISVEVSSKADREDAQRKIFISITNALRFMHRDKVEPSFVKRYRKDYIMSENVLNNLENILDEDAEWDRVISARKKVQTLLESITSTADADESAGVDAQGLKGLQEELEDAQQKLDDTAKQETQVKAELEALAANDDDDDDELFGDNDGADEKQDEKKRLESHLATIQSLLEARADKVSQLQNKVQAVEEQNRALNDPGPVERITKKMSRDNLWNAADYEEYASRLTEARHILDLNAYLNLVKEGNDAIRKKEMPMLLEKESGKESKRRSRRFDRDYYRTCVSEGMRDICYRYLLAPYRVGIKLEDIIKTGTFEYSKTISGEDNAAPMKWVPATIPDSSPIDFANELIGSGELVRLSAAAGGEADASEAKDPLRACRYVAAMELANEPRIRRYLRDIFRRHAHLTTKPTKKGMEEIDAFHDHFGLHLIKSKPVKEHFAADEIEAYSKQAGMSDAEKNEFNLEMKKREKESCLQYLSILKAESAGDISVHIHLPLLEADNLWYKTDNDVLFDRSRQDLSPLLDELKKVYMPPDGDSAGWEKERIDVLNLALFSFLLPQFEAEIRRDLRDAATKIGAVDAAENLRNSAMEGPYRPTAILHTENRFLVPTGELPMVGVCVSHDGKDATYLASVTERGESNDYLAIPGGLRIDSHKMREKVIMFLLQARPAAVVVGTSGGFESRQFQRKMNDLITEAVKRWNNRDIQGDDEDDEAFEARRNQLRQLQAPGYYDDEEEEEWKCNVDLIDDSVAQLYGRSVRGKKEFPDYAVNLKCAIAVARYAQDPLAELTYTWSVASDAGTFGAEMLYLNIHPLQQLLPRTLLLREYERVLCDVVADVGTDLNACCSFDHLRGLLMFVPGLGPRKAANLKQTISKMGGAVARRRDLLEKRLLGPNVYNNAVAFMRIREVDQLADQFLHPLDETRLHPDVYLRNNWAIKIAFDALEREDPKLKDSAAMKALRDVMVDSNHEVERLFNATKSEWEKLYGPTFNIQEWDPRVNVPKDSWADKVEELDLEAFADMIESNGNGRWHSHLDMIKWEFRLPFADPRKPMAPLAGDKLFRLITGETDQSLRPGKEVTGKVIRNGEFGSRVKLEGEIPAFISLRNLSDDHVEAADDFISAGQVVTALVTEIKKDHMTVDMSLKMADFRRNPSSWERPQSLPPIDRHFDMIASNQIEEDNVKKREAHIEALQIALGNKSGTDGEDGGKKRRGRVMRRACTHPAFVNARNDEVDRRLKEGGAEMVGEALIRPSSKSSDSLAVHWVVKEGSIKVIEVVEEDKETDASIGNILKIKGETYESIDELLGRHIAPMNDYVEELINHRKFMDLPEDDVDDKLKAMKKQNPKSIPYALCWMEMHPGYASLRFVASTNARNHIIGISPKGFSWCDIVYSSLDSLINAFKKNPRGIQKTKEKSREPPKEPPSKPPASKGRWGSKAAAPNPPPPPPPGPSNWSARPPPPPMPPAAPPVQPVAAGWGPNNGWNQAPPQSRPPPPNLPPPPPPPPAYAQPAPPRPPPPNLPPPPPSAPPAAPPGFGMPPGGASQGRGRGRTLPAWMSKG